MIIINCPCGQITKLYDTQEAADYLAPAFGWKNPLASLRYYMHEIKVIEGQVVGHSKFFTQEQLDEFVAERGKHEHQ